MEMRAASRIIIRRNQSFMNPYYDPESLGLTKLAEIDDSGSWEFNTLVLWSNEAGQVFYAHDSGCSCPTPFENYYYRGAGDTNLHRLEEHMLRVFEEEVHGFNLPMSERQAFLGAARMALRSGRKPQSAEDVPMKQLVHVMYSTGLDGLEKRKAVYATTDVEERKSIVAKNPWGSDWDEELFDLEGVKEKALNKLSPVEQMVLGVNRY